MVDIVIAGVGNPFRGDDGVGFAVIDLLEKRNSSLNTVRLKGDLVELLELFDTYRHVYLVDASHSQAALGSWACIDAHKQTLPEENRQTSTHGFGVVEAVRLAMHLDKLPDTLIIYAIEGKNFEISNALSPLVAQAAKEVVESIEKDIRACMNIV